MSGNSSFYEALIKTIKVSSIDDTADRAFVETVKLFETLNEVFDERTVDLLMKAWIRAIKTANYGKFTSVFDRHMKSAIGPQRRIRIEMDEQDEEGTDHD